jgi:3-methyladenine DNA glycosylase Mpg
MGKWTKIVIEKSEPRTAKQTAEELINRLLAEIQRKGSIEGVEAYMLQGHSACYVYWLSPMATALLRGAGAFRLPEDTVTLDARPDLAGFTRIPL